jgi:hypothetical protein
MRWLDIRLFRLTSCLACVRICIRSSLDVPVLTAVCQSPLRVEMLRLLLFLSLSESEAHTP